MSKEPVINTSAIRYGHGIMLGFHKCDLMDLVAVLDSGIKRKKIQLAYHREREQKIAAEILEEQVRTGEEFYKILEPMIEIPSNEVVEEIYNKLMNESDD